MCEIIIPPPRNTIVIYYSSVKKDERGKWWKKNEAVPFISILPPFVFNSAAAASTLALPENLRGRLN